MKTIKRIIFFLIQLIALCSCNESKLAKIYVNNTEVNLSHQAYIESNLIFADVLEFAPSLNAEAEYSEDKKVSCVTKNEYMIWFHVDNLSCSIFNTSTMSTTIYTLKKEPKKTDYGIDIPVEDLGTILSYSYTIKDNNIYFENTTN